MLVCTWNFMYIFVYYTLSFLHLYLLGASLRSASGWPCWPQTTLTYAFWRRWASLSMAAACTLSRLAKAELTSLPSSSTEVRGAMPLHRLSCTKRYWYTYSYYSVFTSPLRQVCTGGSGSRQLPSPTWSTSWSPTAVLTTTCCPTSTSTWCQSSTLMATITPLLM